MDAVGAVAPTTVSMDQATAEYTVTLSVDPESTTAVGRPGQVRYASRRCRMERISTVCLSSLMR